MRMLVWLLRAFLFFTLFAFALNNAQPVAIHWFFGAQWQAPMVIVVLVAFASGAALGIAVMLPGGWRRQKRKAVATARAEAAAAVTDARSAQGPATRTPAETLPQHPPRVGL